MQNTDVVAIATTSVFCFKASLGGLPSHGFIIPWGGIGVEGGAGNDWEAIEGCPLLGEGDAEVAAGGGQGGVSHEGLDDAAVDTFFEE